MQRKTIMLEIQVNVIVSEAACKPEDTYKELLLNISSKSSMLAITGYRILSQTGYMNLLSEEEVDCLNEDFNDVNDALNIRR